MQNWTQPFASEMGSSLDVAVGPGTQHLRPVGRRNAGGEVGRIPGEWQQLKVKDEIRFGPGWDQ